LIEDGEFVEEAQLVMTILKPQRTYSHVSNTLKSNLTPYR
jgi:hypothetical protein